MSAARDESTAARTWYEHPIWPVLLVLACIAWMLALRHWSLTMWQPGIDEHQYREYGLAAMNHLPGSLWSLSDYHRGLQRLAPWNLGFALKLFGAPDGFVVARTVICVMWTLTAAPVWCWARSAGAVRALAALASLLSVVVPWALLTTTFLTEAFAYPLATLALYSIWHSAAHPGARPLVWVAVTILAAALARSVMILLVPIAATAIVVSWQRFHPRRSWRRAAVTLGTFFGLVILAAVVVNHLMFTDRSLAGGLVGQYEPGLRIDYGAVARVLIQDSAGVISGVGILPAIVALAFTGRALVRPTGRGDFALALLVPLTCLFVVYSTLRAGDEERYVIYLAPPVLVAAATAVSRRAVGAIGLGTATIGVLALTLGYGWARAGGYEFFTKPASTFHRRILIDGLGARQPLPPGLLLALVVVAGVAFVWWALRRGHRWQPIAVLICAGVLGFQLAQAAYAITKSLSVNRYAPSSLAALGWVDRALPKGEAAVLLATGNRPDWDPGWSTWRDLDFWNLSVGTGVPMPNAGTAGAESPPVALAGRARVDSATGRLIFTGTRPPRYVLQLATPAELGLVGRTVAAGWLPIQLVRLDPPGRVSWWIRGLGEGGWIADGTSATVLTFPRNTRQPPAGTCLTITVAAAANLPQGRIRVRFGAARDALANGATGTLGPVPVGRSAGSVPLTLSGPGERGKSRLLQVRALDAGPCPAAR